MQMSVQHAASNRDTVSGVKSPDPQGELILAVEDDKMLRDFLNIVLGESGYRVMLAADGTEAVQRYMEHANEISLVLLDMGLPGMSGEEVLSKIVTSRPDLKVIAVGGLIRAKARSAVMQLGAHDYISKPYVGKELLDIVHDTLRSRVQAGSCAQVGNNS